MELKSKDLYKKHDQLVELKREAYEKQYQRCISSIKLTSNAGEMVYFFEVPKISFGVGYPMINVRSCASYIMNKLSENKNFRLEFVEPNIIFIDWRRNIDF